MEKSAVSIIVPIYNREDYIKECIESLVNQTFKNIEIILVNDGSTDNSLNIMEEYSKKDARIKVINKPNGGLSSARNRGIKEATSEYIMFVDGDDFVELNTVKELYNKAIKYNLDIVVYDFSQYINGKNRIWNDFKLEDEKVISGFEYLNLILTSKTIFSVCNKLFKRDLYIKNNIKHPENISYGEDGSTLPRLVVNAQRVGKLNKPYYFYRINESSFMSSSNIRFYEYAEAADIVIKYLKNENIGITNNQMFTYKYNYAYKFLENLNFFKKSIKSNENYMKLYESFLEDIKNVHNNIEAKNMSKLGYIKKDLIVKSYRLSRTLGDLVRILFKPVNVFCDKFYTLKNNL